MKKLISAAAQMLAVQTPGSPQSYAGTWIAEFSGTTFVRLELQAANNAVTGRITLGNIELGPKGEVIKAAAAPREFRPISDVVRRESLLSFRSRDVEDLDQFELRLVGADAAELSFIPSDEDKKELAAAGIPVPKPIRLKKVSS